MDAKKVNGSGTNGPSNEWRVKVGLAEMLKDGGMMDVTHVEQAKIAEKAGACAVMALEGVPSDIRKEGGVARMASIKVIREIMRTVAIPVMAKVRIGHFAEAEVLQAREVDFIDESEVLTPADEENHVWKHDYRVPFVCGARNLGEALRRIAEGAAMIRTKGEAGSGNVVEAVRHMRAIVSEMKKLTTMREDELMREAKELGAPLELVRQIAKTGKLPVPNFSAGGIATPADAALVRRLGAEAVFVGSGIFKSSDPEARAKAVVKATTHFEDPKAVLEAHEELGEAMRGLDVRQMEEKDLLATRGGHQPRVASRSFSSICRTSSPRMASPNSSCASSTAFGSSKCVVAFTTALARASGSLDLKIPDPTNTASAPSRLTSAASAGVAIPPAEKFGTGSFPVFAICRTSSSGAPNSFASCINSSSRMVASFFIWLMIARMCRTASTTFPDPASPFVRIIAAPSAMRRSASPRLRAPQTNGTR